jgi:hypothetical protein
MIVDANSEKDRKMRFEMILKRSTVEIGKVKGKLTLPEDPEDDKELMRGLWLIEQGFNASNAGLRLHIHLYDVETHEEKPLHQKPPYGESDPPKRG